MCLATPAVTPSTPMVDVGSTIETVEADVGPSPSSVPVVFAPPSAPVINI
jgi:hypothetical protein